jgi:hypothetical protein
MHSQIALRAGTVVWLFLSTVGLQAGSRPITLSDGSVCLSDEGQPFPDTSIQEHDHTFKLSTVFLERRRGSASQDMKACLPLVTKCDECQEIKDVRNVIVQFRDANATRNVAVEINDGAIRVTSVDLPFGDWQPHGNASDRRKVKRDGPNTKIQWIFVDGRPFDCRTTFCRITFQDDDSTQAP